jgi:hypothetical protein
MSESNAAWWWNENEIGDVVIVENTGRPQSNDGNGLTIWNDEWHQWLERSAAGAVFTEPLLPVPALQTGETAQQVSVAQ